MSPVLPQPYIKVTLFSASPGHTRHAQFALGDTAGLEECLGRLRYYESASVEIVSAPLFIPSQFCMTALRAACRANDVEAP